MTTESEPPSVGPTSIRLVHEWLSHRAAHFAAALLFAACTSASAHDFWIEPSAFNPASGARLDIRLCVGDGAEGWPVARNERRIERFAAISTHAEQPLLGLDGADPAGVARLQTPGSYIVAFESRHSVEKMTANEFSSYLREKGLEPILALREDRGESELAARDAYSRHAKALIRVGAPQEAPIDRAVDRAIGLRLELIADLDRAGDAHIFTLLYAGKPLTHALVTATRLGAPGGEIHARTDREGRATLNPGAAGVWRVAAVHMIEARDKKIADWESLWASLTFELSPHQSLDPRQTPSRSGETDVCRNQEM